MMMLMCTVCCRREPHIDTGQRRQCNALSLGGYFLLASLLAHHSGAIAEGEMYAWVEPFQMISLLLQQVLVEGAAALRMAVGLMQQAMPEQ